ncbi:Scr1 family TA system antitoxin-like transcriptional regulator [Streptomyces sp. NPDC048324]|uniref:Scr1 family TA system antitoxin-like transcriptional regulator n=1 Tax=Streptomyces sp. NPDC048324 TaxID=3157205 RepID=UPI003434DD83
MVLYENVLRVPASRQSVMARQLEYVAKLGPERMVMVQVLSHAAGACALMIGSLRLIEFEDAPPTAYTEAVSWGTCWTIRPR